MACNPLVSEFQRVIIWLAPLAIHPNLVRVKRLSLSVAHHQALYWTGIPRYKRLQLLAQQYAIDKRTLTARPGD